MVTSNNKDLASSALKNVLATRFEHFLAVHVAPRCGCHDGGNVRLHMRRPGVLNVLAKQRRLMMETFSLFRGADLEDKKSDRQSESMNMKEWILCGRESGLLELANVNVERYSQCFVLSQIALANQKDTDAAYQLNFVEFQEALVRVGALHMPTAGRVRADDEKKKKTKKQTVDP